MKRHYHILVSSAGGYMPDSRESYATKTDAQAGLRWHREQFADYIADCNDGTSDAEQTFKLFGSIRSGLVGYHRPEYVYDLAYYAEIVSCTDDECACETCGGLLSGEDIAECEECGYQRRENERQLHNFVNRHAIINGRVVSTVKLTAPVNGNTYETLCFDANGIEMLGQRYPDETAALAGHDEIVSRLSSAG